MLTAPSLKEEDFFAFTRSLYESIDEKDRLKRLRAQSWERFLELGIPTKKTEVYRYIRLRHLFDKNLTTGSSSGIPTEEIATLVAPECRESYFVIVNGHFVPELSNTAKVHEKVVALPMDKAMATYSGLLNSQWAKQTKEETDAFAAMNAALHPQGLFIYVPPNVVSETPIQILSLAYSEKDPLITFPRAHLFLGANAQAEIFTSFKELGTHGSCQNQVIDASLEENAHLHITQDALDQHSDSWIFDALRLQLKRNSTARAVGFTEGSLTVRRDYKASILGEGVDACLNGLSLLDEKRASHTNVLIDHQAPNCRSNQLFKNALTDLSHSSFEGKIYVRREAQKTEAYQLNNNLLLSDKANADSKPNLEIFADDVKASHGATVGQLDKDELFYLMTRGIKPTDAKNLLIASFCRDLIDLVKLPSLKKVLIEKASNYLA